MQMTKQVLVIIDKYGWSYDTIAKGLVAHNGDEGLRLDVLSAREDDTVIERTHGRYDLVFVLGWTSLYSAKPKHALKPLLPFLDPARVITGIHSHRSWDGYASTPEHSPKPPEALLERLAQVRGVNIISKRLWRLFDDAGLNNITLTENGVDTHLFSPIRPVGQNPTAPLVLGFSGSTEIAKHDKLKGFSEFIAPLESIPGVQVRALGGRGEGQVSREEMPALYNLIDLYICASSSEGFSQSVLEAAACGRGVISTRVGGCEDLIREGINGFLVPRQLAAFRAVIERLVADRPRVAELGGNNRRIVESEYAWSRRAEDWLRFVRLHLGMCETA